MTKSLHQKGFTRIPNDVIEAVMRAGFTKRERLMLDYIFRNGFGYNRPFSKCERDVSRIAKYTRLDHSHINATIRALIAKKIIKIEQGAILFIWDIEQEYDVEGASEEMGPKQPREKANTALVEGQYSLEYSCNTLTNSDLPLPKESLYKKETPISPIKEPLKEPCQSKQAIDEIIAFLNETTGKSFRPSSKQTQRFIRARLAESFTIEDFRTVIKVKSDQWKGDTTYDRYLRPETLFSNKFEGYLQESKRVTKTQTAFGFDTTDTGIRGYCL